MIAKDLHFFKNSMTVSQDTSIDKLCRTYFVPVPKHTEQPFSGKRLLQGDVSGERF